MVFKMNMAKMCYESVMKKQWRTKTIMSNSTLLCSVITVTDIAKKIKADKEKGIVRTRPLQPTEPWVLDLAVKEAKKFAAIYGSKLVSINIKPKTK